jgi:hypothetical protein
VGLLTLKQRRGQSFGEQAKSSRRVEMLDSVLQKRGNLLLLRCWWQHFSKGAGQVWQPSCIQGDAISVLLEVLPGPTLPGSDIPILRFVSADLR